MCGFFFSNFSRKTLFYVKKYFSLLNPSRLFVLMTMKMEIKRGEVVSCSFVSKLFGNFKKVVFYLLHAQELVRKMYNFLVESLARIFLQGNLNLIEVETIG